MEKLHLDSPIEHNSNGYLYEKFEDTPEGFLKGRAVVTNIGIFPYYVNGKIENRLRTPEDVMSQDSLETLKMAVLTDDHPTVQVDSENVKELQVGHLGTEIYSDGYSVSVDIIITDAATIQKVKRGKVALSCGYFADIEQVSGRKWGQEYDSKQKNIRYNHVAIVDVGRAGDDARMYIDSLQQTYICGIDSVQKIEKPQDLTNTDSKEHTMDKITVDNKELEVSKDSAEVIKAIVQDRDALKSEKDALSTKATYLEGQLDSLKSELSKVELEKKELADSLEGLVSEGVNAKIQVLEVAKQLKVECDAKDSVLSLKKKIVLSQSDNAEALAAILEAKGAVYVDGHFDRIAASIVDASEAQKQVAAAVLDAQGKQQKEAQEGKLISADAARENYRKSILKKEVK